MSEHDTPQGVAAVWMQYADVDMQFARFGLSQRELHKTAAYHAQQAIEKAMKAMCVMKQVGFDKTHDLARLLNTVESLDPDFAEKWRHLSRVTQYAIIARYPVDILEYAISPPEAVELAEQFMKAVKQWMDDQPGDG